MTRCVAHPRYLPWWRWWLDWWPVYFVLSLLVVMEWMARRYCP